jgi:excisionase family DNA binding protein
MNDNDEILTVEEVAKYLKLKPQTVYKWAQTGQIPAAKFGKEWRFRKSILDDWINTSITLSEAGFELMLNKSALHLYENKTTENKISHQVDSLLDDLFQS